MHHKDFFSQIKDFSHSLSIFLTFTLEKEVIQKIRENTTGRTVIIHDVQQGVSLDENYENRLVCIPANLKSGGMNCFHPKLAILKGEDKLRILIGSMNLSRSSFSGRQEVCIQKDISPGTKIYDQIIQFLKTIRYSDLFNIDFISELIPQQTNFTKEEKESLDFIFNDEASSIYDKFIEVIEKQQLNQPVLKIASPFISKDLPIKFDEFIEKLKPKTIEIYTRASNRIPPRINNVHTNVKIFGPDKKKSKNGFHAKIISVDCGDRLIVYIGSANFTKQGFFSSITEFGNQECGFIMDIRDPIEIKQINEWYNKDWKKPCHPDDWNVKVEVDHDQENFSNEPYAFAAREGKDVKIEIFIPGLTVKGKHFKVNSKRFYFSKSIDGLYKTTNTFDEKTENLSIIIDNYKIKIKIFDGHEFDKIKQMDGDGLFSFIDSPIESINIIELSKSIDKLGIKAGNGNYEIIEPPKLEQFYYNVKRGYESIIRKKFLTKSHLMELEEVLNKLEGGTGAYAAMQFIKAFSYLELKQKILLNEFKEECKSKINICLQSMGENESKFNKFLNLWVKKSVN